MAISPKVAKPLTWNFNTGFWPWKRIRRWSRVAKCQSKMAAAAILDFWTNLNNSAIHWAIVMKFYKNNPNDSPKGTKWKKWSPEVNSRWCRPPSWISLNGQNSAIFQPICTKSGPHFLSLCEILCQSVEKWLSYGRLAKFKMAAAAILNLLPVIIFTIWFPLGCDWGCLCKIL